MGGIHPATQTRRQLLRAPRIRTLQSLPSATFRMQVPRRPRPTRRDSRIYVRVTATSVSCCIVLRINPSHASPCQLKTRVFKYIWGFFFIKHNVENKVLQNSILLKNDTQRGSPRKKAEIFKIIIMKSMHDTLILKALLSALLKFQEIMSKITTDTGNRSSCV